MRKIEIITESPAATRELGHKIGEKLKPGTIFALTGELGCGKTLLTRGIAEGLGVPSRHINSPTFVLVNEYKGRMPIFHMDLYRLGNIDDGFEIGIMDYFNRTSEGVMLIEWAEKMASLLPEDVIKVEYEILGEEKRRIVFSTSSKKYEGLFREIR
jgi:tRNA threonylcarbamoyladenosine biosynthesis protein TsaE